MDLSRILNMVINIVLRRLISRGVDAGFGLVSGLGRRRKDRAEGGSDTLDEAQHKASRLNPPPPPQA